MTTQGLRPVVRLDAVAIGLLAVSFVLLFAGGFVQFDDVSGFGSDQWVMPLGLLAGITAAASVGVALAEAEARRLLGAALLVLDAFLIWQTVTNDGFRFIWSGDEGQLLPFVVVLALVGLMLMATAVRRTGSGRMTDRPGVRVVAYLSVAVLAAFAAFSLGAAHSSSTSCGDNYGECDLAGVEGLMWAAVATVLAVVAAVVIEVLRVRRPHRGESSGR